MHTTLPMSDSVPPMAISDVGIRHDWTRAEVEALFTLPFSDLMYQAQTVHRNFFNPNEVQVSTLCSIKTGACPEDCAYCPQSARYDTGLEREKLMAVEKVIEEAKAAKASGATRFCMGAAWRSPKGKDMPYVTSMVQGVMFGAVAGGSDIALDIEDGFFERRVFVYQLFPLLVHACMFGGGYGARAGRPPRGAPFPPGPAPPR